MKRYWAIWCKTIGNKIDDDSSVADKAAILRTCFLLLEVITCAHIIFNVWRGVSTMSQTKTE